VQVIVAALRSVYPPGYNSERNAQRITSPLMEANRSETPRSRDLQDVRQPGLQEVVRSPGLQDVRP
jgi:hypothetical protein